MVSAVSAWSSPDGWWTAEPAGWSWTAAASPPTSSARSWPNWRPAPKSWLCEAMWQRRGVAESLIEAAGQAGRELRGVVHAAAVIEDSMLFSMTRESLERVWAPKAAGALRMHQASAELRARLVARILLRRFIIGLSRAGGVRVCERVARRAGHVAQGIRPAGVGDQLGAVVGGGCRPGPGRQCSRYDHSGRGHRGTRLTAGRRPAPHRRRPAACRQGAGRIPGDSQHRLFHPGGRGAGHGGRPRRLGRARRASPISTPQRPSAR